MSMIFASLMPVFLILLIGWGLKTAQIIHGNDWAGFEKVCYFVFFPAIVIVTLAKARMTLGEIGSIGSALMAGVLIMAGLLLLSRPYLSRLTGMTGPQFTSLFQGSTRWNTFIAIALSSALHGEKGLALIAIAIAALVPMLNILAVLILLKFGDRDPSQPVPSPALLAKTIAANPFVWSCCVGILINVSGLKLPAIALSVGELLGQAALAGGLLLVGSGLDIRRLARPGPVHLIAVMAKLVVMPLIVWGIALVLKTQGANLTIAVMAASVPSASASYIMARRMGGDADMMAEIMTFQTLAAIITMPLLIGITL
jgi:malonate transporter and related proteins